MSLTHVGAVFWISTIWDITCNVHIRYRANKWDWLLFWVRQLFRVTAFRVTIITLYYYHLKVSLLLTFTSKHSEVSISGNEISDNLQKETPKCMNKKHEYEGNLQTIINMKWEGKFASDFNHKTRTKITYNMQVILKMKHELKLEVIWKWSCTWNVKWI